MENRTRQGAWLIAIGLGICALAGGVWAYQKSQWDNDALYRKLVGSAETFSATPYIVGLVVGGFVALAGVIIYAAAPSTGGARPEPSSSPSP